MAGVVCVVCVLLDAESCASDVPAPLELEETMVEQLDDATAPDPPELLALVVVEVR